MRAGILTIGRELLTGRILDKNQTYLAGILAKIGIMPRFMFTVDDNIEDIKLALTYISKPDVKVIITTGGLGPTADDMTLMGIAQFLGRELKLHPKAKEMVKSRYAELYESGLVDTAKLTPERLKMAKLPEGGIPLYNRVGTAPGVFIKTRSRLIFALPGVPKEMKPMFEYEVLPRIMEEFSQHLYGFKTKVFLTGERDESIIETKVIKLREEFPMFYFKTRADMYGESVNIRLEVTAQNDVWGNIGKVLQERLKTLFKGLSEFHE